MAMARQDSGIVDKYKPLERYGHSLANLGGKLYVWAGGMRQMPAVHASAAKEDLMSKTDVLHLKTGKWESSRTRGSSHSGISYYASATINNDIFYFGGQCGHGTCYYNNITMLSTSEMRWKDVRTNFIGAPMKKYSCGMVSFQCEGEVYLFVVGGYGELVEVDRQPNALYVQSTSNPNIWRTNEHHIISPTKNKWLTPAVGGDVPPPCSGFTLTSLGNNRAIMFGGYHSGKSKVNSVYLAELTKDQVTWMKLDQPLDAPWPIARCDHAAVILSGHAGRQPHPILVIAGGIDNKGIMLTDCWLLDIVSGGVWMKIDAPEDEVGRAIFSMSIMNIGAQYVWLIIFGGVKKWEKGKSTKDQGLSSDTTPIELGWRPDRQEWSFVSVVSEGYQQKLKDRLLERRRSLGLD